MHIQFPSNEDYASQLNETVMQIVMNYHKNKQKDAFRNDFDTFTEFSKSKIRRTKDKVHF